MMLPESSTSYSQIISAPAAMTPSSKSDPLISNIPMKSVVVDGVGDFAFHKLELDRPGTSGFERLARLEGLLTFLGN